MASVCNLKDCLIRSRPQPGKINSDGKHMMVLLHRKVATLLDVMQKVTWESLETASVGLAANLASLSQVMPSLMQQIVLYLRVQATLSFVVLLMWLFVLA